MSGRIFYTKPSIGEREVAYATDAARNGWGAQCYDYIHRFEAHFRAFTGAKHAFATSSCTGALHMGLAALGVGPGDEVILADTNWIASAAPITYLGAAPVLVDVLRDTWCIDPALAERAITPHTKAIMAVHLYGNMCEMDRLLEIGAKHGIPVIEDAAEAIGSAWRGRCAGSLGTFGTFSFHGTKTVTTGEGGMLVTSDDGLAEKLRSLHNHGRRPGQTRQFWPEDIGFKYKIANVQAAIGCAQMERADELIARKREIFAYYQNALARLPGAALNPEPAGTRNGYWMPTLVLPGSAGVTREDMVKAFAAVDIDARVFFHPLSSLPMFAPKPENRVAYDLPLRAINLPSYHDLTDADQDRVIDVVMGLCAAAKGAR